MNDYRFFKLVFFSLLICPSAFGAGLDAVDPANRSTSLDGYIGYQEWGGTIGDSWSMQGEIAGTYAFNDRWSVTGVLPYYADRPIWKPVWWLDYSDYRIRQLPIDEGVLVKGHDHLYDLALTVTYKNVGLHVVLPTSEDGTAARGQILVGPQFAASRTREGTLIGFQLTHLIDVHGDKDFTTNETRLNLVWAHKRGDWIIESSPDIVIDWAGVSNNRLIVPLSLGVYRTFTKLTLGTEVNYFVVRPDRFSPLWNIEFKFTLQ